VASNNKLAESLLATESTRQMLIEANQTDLALYKFVREELYPYFQHEYGPRLEADVARYREIRGNNFNDWNLTMSRLKQFLVYKLALTLSREVSEV
jgi:hypothetical protein